MRFPRVPEEWVKEVNAIRQDFLAEMELEVETWRGAALNDKNLAAMQVRVDHAAEAFCRTWRVPFPLRVKLAKGYETGKHGLEKWAVAVYSANTVTLDVSSGFVPTWRVLWLITWRRVHGLSGEECLR